MELISKDLTSMTSERIERIKTRILSSPQQMDIERARYFTRVWKEMEDKSPSLRAARALETTLNQMTIRIDDDDQLIGVRTKKPLGGIMPVERHRQSSGEGENLGRRKIEGTDTGLTEEERRELQEMISPYWKGKTAHDYKIKLWKDQGLITEHNPFGVLYDVGIVALDTQGHTVPGYKRVLKLGFKGIEAWAEQELSLLSEESVDYECHKDFFEAVKITSRAVCAHTERYRLLLKEKASMVEGERKKNLLELAERCVRVPAYPAENFLEAVQSVWMTHVVLLISYGYGDVFSTGRIDQYLYPYYQADLVAGKLTQAEASQIIDELHLKMATHVQSANNTITLGGLTREGKDAVNEISYLFLEATEKIGAIRTNISVRISPNTPKRFLEKAWMTHRTGAGVAFYNDSIIIRDLMADGYALEDARDYSIVGCVEPTSTGNDFSYTAGNAISFLKALELTLNQGRFFHQQEGGPGTPTPPVNTFQSFEAFQKAYADQLTYAIDKCVRVVELKDRVYAEHFPAPLLSSTIEGCLENGKDVTRGGAVYNNGHIGVQGLATAVNSLAAIRWAVFEEKLLSLDELVNHLRNNFSNGEGLRQVLQNKPPKYGNDVPEVDELAEWLVEHFCQEVRKHRCGRGGVYRPLILSSGFQAIEGLLSNATPDGRRAGEPVSDGISPAHGTEHHGLTAVLHSAAKAGKSYVSDGTTLTLTLSPSLLKTREDIKKMAALTEAYFELGGRQVQFTPVDTETLRDAQKNPDKYPTLTVKVSGYSALFVDLPKSLQNDIIDRTEFRDL